jgi:hypothetical protein
MIDFHQISRDRVDGAIAQGAWLSGTPEERAAAA